MSRSKKKRQNQQMFNRALLEKRFTGLGKTEIIEYLSRMRGSSDCPPQVEALAAENSRKDILIYILQSTLAEHLGMDTDFVGQVIPDMDLAPAAINLENDEMIDG